MSVEYKDYYKILNVAKTATKDDISKAFKKLARKYHPDLNPNKPEAEKKFKEINEAYEVLKDEEKRKLYDSLGPNWKDGQNFQPPPGFENFRFDFGQGGARDFGGFGGFSNFFETIFGGQGGGFEQGGFGSRFSRRSKRGDDAEVALELTLEEAYHGGAKSLTLQEHVVGADGRPSVQTKTLQVNIPQGVRDGAKIRLSGQGNPGVGGGKSGDLYLKVHLLTHHLFKTEGTTIIHDLHLSPWEAVLGAKVKVPTMEGFIEMSIPSGSGSGRKMRIRGKGLGKGEHKGDQIVRLMIKSPDNLTSEERNLWENLARVSAFNPRDY